MSRARGTRRGEARGVGVSGRAPGLALALVGLLAGCQARLTGTQGELVFAYETPLVDVTNFNKPVAVGARLDLEVTPVGQGGSVELEGVESSDGSVLAVLRRGGGGFVVEGRAPGGVRLTVRARVDGRQVEDAVHMLVREAQVVSLRHTCSEGRSAYYEVGSRVGVPFSLWRSNQEPVIGYGLQPVVVEPASGARLLPAGKAQTMLGLQLGAKAQTVTLRPERDGAPLELRLVERGAIDGFLTDEDLGRAPRVIEGEVVYVGVWPTIGGEVLCQGREPALEVTSETPDVCAVSAQVDEAARLQARPAAVGVIELEGLGYGVCEYTVTAVEARGGRGVTRRLRALVGSFPRLEEARRGAGGVAAASWSRRAATPPGAGGEAGPGRGEEGWPRWLLVVPLIVLGMQLIMAPLFVYLARRVSRTGEKKVGG